MSTGNRIRLLFVILVAAGVTLLTMLGGSKAEVAYHITSPDKKLEIKIPEEAIPLDVDVLDIALTPVAGGYALQPDDLMLNGTVTISLAVRMEDGTALVPRFTLHTDEKSYEPVDIRVRRHHTINTAVIKVDTEDFRWIELQ